MNEKHESSADDKDLSQRHSLQLVCLAAERTLMAWIRTALGLMALGFVIDRFGLFLREALPKHGSAIFPESFSIWSGALMVLAGALMALTASLRYLHFYRHIELEEPTDTRKGVIVAVAFSFVIALAGFILTIIILSTLK
jgi:putative membrane protein